MFDPGPSDTVLVKRWVRWVAGFSRFRNPISDRTGKRAAVRQPDDVFFLAGNFGGRTSRRCAVPAGRPLFFPVFNYWKWADNGPLMRVVSAGGAAMLDGSPLAVTEIGTPEPFEVRGAWFNPITNSLGSGRAEMLCWGLWASTPPLAPGGHMLHISGTDGHRFRVEVDYTITAR